MKSANSIGRLIVIVCLVLFAGIMGCLDSQVGNDGKRRGRHPNGQAARPAEAPEKGAAAIENVPKSKTVAGLSEPEAQVFREFPTITPAQVTIEEGVTGDIRHWGGKFSKAGDGTALKRHSDRPVVGVDFQGNDELTDESVSTLTGLSQLASLQLSNTKIGDVALAHIGKMRSLEVLLLSDTRITDRGVAALAGLSKLRELNLSGTKVTGSGLNHLKELPNLQKLDLNGTLVDNTGLSVLKEFPDLRDVVVGRDPARRQRDDTKDEEYYDRGPNLITDAGLRVFTHMPRLKRLQLCGGGITDDCLTDLEELSQLNTLVFAGTFVTDKGVKWLQQRLGECQISLTQKRDPNTGKGKSR